MNVRYGYVTGSVGLVAMRSRSLGGGMWAIERYIYLGRGVRAQRIVALLRAAGRGA